MRTLGRCSALALLSLLACAEDHEGRTTGPEPLPPVGASKSGDADEAPGNSASRDNGERSDEPPTRNPATTVPPPENADEDLPPVASPPLPTPPPAWPPVLSSSAGWQTGISDLCAKQSFDSLSPGEVLMPSPCSYRVPNWPRIVDPKYIRVIVDGSTRQLGQAANGWLVAEDGYSVTLLGTACEAARAGTEISITSECIPVPAI